MLKKSLPIILATAGLQFSLASQANEALQQQVKDHYAELAHIMYSDSLDTAKSLQSAIDTFIADPNEATHQAAKEAWKASRVPYGQTEVYRFGNANVDDWEGQVNAWPLDEGLIDYVDTAAYEYEEGNEFGAANIIAGSDEINADLLRSMQEAGGSEANVATGYHAVEFLLWGQDLNAEPQNQGLRSHTDYLSGDSCTNGNCDRRGQYLKAATDLLVSDLEDIVADWAPDAENYRAEFVALDNNEAIRRMLFGMGSLSLGELAGERINVALLANSQEDEHSCFSDNTHVDIIENARGIRNVYLGEYTDSKGNAHTGASLSQLVAEKDADLDNQLKAALDNSMEKVDQIGSTAETGTYFDHQILPDYPEQNDQVRAAIDALKSQTVDIEKAAAALSIDSLEPETSDSFNS